MEISVAAASDTSTCTTGSLYWTHPRLRGALFTRGAGAIPLRLWIRAVIVVIPHICVQKQRICECRRSGYDPSVAERPKLAVRVSAHFGNRVCPLCKQQTPGEARSKSNSESAEVCRRPRGTNNSGRGRPTLTEDRSTGG